MLADSIGGIIEIPDSTQQPYAQTLGGMARNVASVMNGEDDPELLDVARKGIRWAVTYADISREFMFGAETQTVVPLTAEQNTIQLGSNFFGVRAVEVVMTDNNPSYPQELSSGEYPSAGILPYEPWNEFLRNHPDLVTSDLAAWSANNTFKDGRIHIRHRPNAQMADWYAIKVHHFTPTSLPSADNDIISAPFAYSQVIEEGAKYYVLFERKREDTFGFRHQFGIFENMLARFGAHERRRQGSKNAAWKIGEPQ